MQSTADQERIEFFFDPVSPYAWLASARLESLSRKTGCQILAVPILFAGLLKANDHKGPAEIATKRVYTFCDVMRRAKACGLDFRGPPNHPFNPLLVLRICTAIEDKTVRLRFSCLILEAAWAQGEDISDDGTVARLAEKSGIDAGWAIDMAHDPLIKKKLADTTRAAIDTGVFGVPTLRIDDQLFWGEDRIDDLIRYRQGLRIDQHRLAEFLGREPSARRR